MLVSKCVPTSAHRLYSFSPIVFPQVKLSGEGCVCVVPGEAGSSCSYLHLLGKYAIFLWFGPWRLSSSSVQKGMEGGGSKDTSVFWHSVLFPLKEI